MDSNSERKCDESTPSKEELDSSCISMKETVLKRERIKEYSFNHRVSKLVLFHVFLPGSFGFQTNKQKPFRGQQSQKEVK